MLPVELVLPVVTSFAISWVVVKKLADPKSALVVLDKPNERSLHTNPTPRNGGLGILAGQIVGWPVILFSLHAGYEAWIIFGAMLAQGAVSHLDDRRSLPVRVRLGAQAAIAVALILFGFRVDTIAIPALGMLDIGWVGYPFSFLFIVWMVNLYNFMDGMDGFAGGMAAFGFGALAVIGFQAGQTLYAAAALTIVAACCGFLVWNFPPAKIFMGDAGSTSLGLAAAAFGLWGMRLGLFELWVPVLIFAPFILDATVTLLKRLARGEKIWQAHRTHYYQRMVLLGYGHKNVVLMEYALMAMCAGAAIALNRADAKVVGVGLIAAVFLLVAAGVGVGALERRQKTRPVQP